MTTRSYSDKRLPFRSLFIRKLEEAGVALSLMDGPFRFAMKMSPLALFKLLWAMSFTHSCESALNKFGVTTDPEKKGLILIPENLVVTFRNELKVVYSRLVMPSFIANYRFKRSLPYNDFKYRIGNDIVLAVGIYQKVVVFLLDINTSPKKVQKVCSSLFYNCHDQARNALLDLGFTWEEATELLPKRYAIATLLANLEEPIDLWGGKYYYSYFFWRIGIYQPM